MKKLLSLPPNLVGSFHEITELPKSEWFCTNDPVGKKLGSGGGTTWLLRAAYEANDEGRTFDEWLAADKRLLLHAGGQSRRLPSYAPSGRFSHRCLSSVGSAVRVFIRICSRCRCLSISASWTSLRRDSIR